MSSPKKIVIVGGGPVGTISALLFAQHGSDSVVVELYERRRGVSIVRTFA
jgi:2-polyprenyl-6-methoxyphenol hydroxylase-like FAD-dependent oxidoreductase